MPRWMLMLQSRWRWLLRRGRAEADLAAELCAHRERLVAAHLDSGLSAAEARRLAALEFGPEERWTESARDARGLRPLLEFGRDLRLGLRQLRRSPGFTGFAVLTLALGIGLNTGLFTIISSFTLRPLPLPGAGRLVAVAQDVRATHGNITRDVYDDASFVSWLEYRRYASENRSLDGLLAYSPFVDTTLGGEEKIPVIGTLASCNYFAVLGLHPARGRFFDSGECRAAGASPVAVLSDHLWRKAFDADPTVIGRSVTFNRTAFTVIGIAPAGFTGTVPVASAFWAPLTMQMAFSPDFNRLTDDHVSWLALLGRLRPGVSRAQAAADLNLVASRLNALQPNRLTRVTLQPASLLAMPAMRSALAPAATMLLVAVALVLLLACANLAGFLLARGEGRRKEVAVRLALGARPARLVRQLLTESLLLGLLGAGAGAWAAAMGTPAVLRLALAHLPIPPEFALAPAFTPDWRTWLYAMLLALVTAVALGLAPARSATRADLSQAMRSTGDLAQTAPIRAARWQRWLVGLQVAAAMVLLLAAGLLLRSLQRVLTADPGFQLTHIEAVDYDLATAAYSPARATDFQRRFSAAVAAMPGVAKVAQATELPLSGSRSVTGMRLSPDAPSVSVEINSVSPSFFSLLGIPLVRGRSFTAAEIQSGARVLILQRSAARRFWPGGDALGKSLRAWGESWQVVGITADAHLDGFDDVLPYAFLPAGPKDAANLKLLVSAAGGSAALGRDITARARQLDGALVVAAAPLSANLQSTSALTKLISAVASLLSGLALLLAVIGVYGMVAYAASRRRREMGIRLALGARRPEVLRLLLRQSLTPVLWGAAAGTTLFAGLGLVLAGVLNGISPWDPWAYLAMPLLLLAVALIAAYLPARRALAADPATVLRCE